jgi:hypothetical protein
MTRQEKAASRSREREKLAEIQLTRDLRRLVGMPEFLRVLEWLYGESCLLDSGYLTDHEGRYDTHAVAYRDGRRCVGLRVYRKIESLKDQPDPDVDQGIDSEGGEDA